MKASIPLASVNKSNRLKKVFEWLMSRIATPFFIVAIGDKGTGSAGYSSLVNTHDQSAISVPFPDL